MTSGPEDPRAAAYSRLRASDADREQVIDTLKVAFAQGRLTKEELDLRAGQAFASRTYADLAAVTADLPAGRAEARPLPKLSQAPGRAPESTVIRWGLGVGTGVLSAMIAAGKLTGNDVVGNVTVYLLMAYCLFMLISVGYAVDLQLENAYGRPAGRRRYQLFPISADETRATCEQTARGRTGTGRGHRLTSGSLTYRRYASSNSGEPGASM